FEPADGFFSRSLAEFAAQIGVRLVLHPNPMFLTSASDWETYSRSHKRRLMADFYTWQRRRLRILVDESGQPKGGQWSFDAENRHRLPPKLEIPYAHTSPPDAITKEVMAMVQTEFTDHAGSADNFDYPVDHKGALLWLDDFLENRLTLFGTYEDAISKDERIVFHSVLSPLINIGLLTPSQVIEAVLARHRREPVPLNSLEGFIRQVIGWREFVRGIDRDYEHMSLPAGPFNHHRKLKECWYEGTTGLPPLDNAINRAKNHGYCHHIERLMILGAAMLMCEVEPFEANQWFMEMFVDATAWVMRPNVVGMSQFADGGYFATKPYISGSNYILKMSDYEKIPWCEVWDGLYWRFIHQNRAFFAANPRLSVMVKGVDRLEPARKERIFAAADGFIDDSTTKPAE
ncbi:MAG: cryptochrome/photolyase family protein, partial [Fimbriimonas sp.]